MSDLDTVIKPGLTHWEAQPESPTPTLNLEPSTWEPSTWNLQPGTFNLQPSIHNPQPSSTVPALTLTVIPALT